MSQCAQSPTASGATVDFGVWTRHDIASGVAMGHGLARLGDPPYVRAANELPATAPSRACMRLSSRVRCRLRACSWPEIANHIPEITKHSPEIANHSTEIANHS